MTTELEQEFFKVFEIEPFCDLPCNKRGVECTDNTYCGNKYPEITDRRLLEMICILSQWDADNYYQILANNMQDLENEILNDCINFKQKLKNGYFNAKIQQLFKEELK